MERSEQINELTAALAKAQAKITPASKDSINDHFKSRYATLASVWDACRLALSSEGLSVIQLPSGQAPNVVMTTILAHSSGQWISTEQTFVSINNTSQAVGSCVTYARRYGLASVVGVAPDDDDDGNAASGPPKPQERPATKAQEKPAARPAHELKDDGPQISDDLRKLLKEMGCKSPQEADAVIRLCTSNQQSLEKAKAGSSEAVRAAIEMTLAMHMRECGTRDKALPVVYNDALSLVDNG